MLGVLQIWGLGSGVDDVPAIRAPARIGLNKSGIVRTGQVVKLARFSVEHAQDALDGEEQLREGQLWHGHEDRHIFDRADDVPAVRRYPGQQAMALLAVILIGPGDDVLRGQHRLFLYLRDYV